MMQCTKECVAVILLLFYNLLLAELWLRHESCQLVGLPATSIKLQATGSKGESNVIIPEVTHRKNWSNKGLWDRSIEASCRHRQGLAPSTKYTESRGRLTSWNELELPLRSCKAAVCGTCMSHQNQSCENRAPRDSPGRNSTMMTQCRMRHH